MVILESTQKAANKKFGWRGSDETQILDQALIELATIADNLFIKYVGGDVKEAEKMIHQLANGAHSVLQ